MEVRQGPRYSDSQSFLIRGPIEQLWGFLEQVSFCLVTPSSVTVGYQRFGGLLCLHLQGEVNEAGEKGRFPYRRRLFALLGNFYL
jgi:hypothetical protein